MFYRKNTQQRKTNHNEPCMVLGFLILGLARPLFFFHTILCPWVSYLGPRKAPDVFAYNIVNQNNVASCEAPSYENIDKRSITQAGRSQRALHLLQESPGRSISYKQLKKSTQKVMI